VAPAPAPGGEQPDTQKVLMQVLALTPAQIQMLPPADRQAILELVSWLWVCGGT